MLLVFRVCRDSMAQTGKAMNAEERLGIRPTSQPTLRELGYDVAIDAPTVVLFPKGTDKAITRKWKPH